MSARGLQAARALRLGPALAPTRKGSLPIRLEVGSGVVDMEGACSGRGPAMASGASGGDRDGAVWAGDQHRPVSNLTM